MALIVLLAINLLLLEINYIEAANNAAVKNSIKSFQAGLNKWFVRLEKFLNKVNQVVAVLSGVPLVQIKEETRAPAGLELPIRSIMKIAKEAVKKLVMPTFQRQLRLPRPKPRPRPKPKPTKPSPSRKSTPSKRPTRKPTSRRTLEPPNLPSPDEPGPDGLSTTPETPASDGSSTEAVSDGSSTEASSTAQ